MKMMSAALAAAAMITGAGAAQATTLYDNGPINGQLDGFTLGGGYAVSDSFTLASASTLTGVNFGAWSAPGDTIKSIDWGITTDPKNYDAHGRAAVNEGTTLINGYDYNVGTASFALPNVTLAAGTYYLVLQNAVTANGNLAYWDENNGPSSASDSGLGNLAGFDVPGSTGSESFQIIGTTAAVPETATWAMMIGGIGLTGGALRRRRAVVRTSVTFA